LSGASETSDKCGLGRFFRGYFVQVVNSHLVPGAVDVINDESIALSFPIGDDAVRFLHKYFYRPVFYLPSYQFTVTGGDQILFIICEGNVLYHLAVVLYLLLGLLLFQINDPEESNVLTGLN